MSSNASEAEAHSDKTIADLLRLQLAELEMLTSMYPNESEFRVDDPSAIPEILDFCEGQGKDFVMPQRLDFTINLHVEKVTLELYCSLPHDYPLADPEAYVRAASGLDREQQHKLNVDMTTFLQSLPEGELRVLVLIQWLSENGAKYVDASRRKPEEEENGPQSAGSSEPEAAIDCDMSFSRFWIYSHHIYNKAKRRGILETADDNRLTGFCLPGKPGFICAEGYAKDCDRFWEIIKGMNWKRIAKLRIETLNPKDHVGQASNHNNNSKICSSIDDWRRFETFQEVCFKPRQGPGREYHMDMGEFFKFLEDHHSGYVFKTFFGVEGKLTNHNGHS